MEKQNDTITYDKNSAIFKINPKIYPLDVVHCAAYIMIDKAFITLDGDPEKEMIVSIRCKKSDQNPKELTIEFNEELLNYSVYKAQSEKNKELREALIKRVLLTNEVISCMEELKKEIFMKNLEDPEGIFKSWEENDRKEKADKVE
jgi:His-Xaa-Ser system protein HxsD